MKRESNSLQRVLSPPWKGSWLMWVSVWRFQMAGRPLPLSRKDGKAGPRLSSTQSIVSAIANKSLYQAKSKEFQNLMERLWSHSLATAYGSKALAKRVGIPDEEKMFFMGLVHDIGKALLIRAIDEIASLE